MASDTSHPIQGTLSPIGQLLESLGMTREDLSRHSVQMRHFLTAENFGSLRALEHAQPLQQQDSALPRPRPMSRETSVSSTSVTQLSSSYASQPSSSVASTRATPPPMPQPTGLGAPAVLTYENLARHSHQQNADRDAYRRQKDREEMRRLKAIAAQTSPTATRPKPSLDMIMQLRSRESKRVEESSDSEESGGESMQDVISKRQQHASSKPSSYYQYPNPFSDPQAHASTSFAQPSHPRTYYREEALQKDPSPVEPVNVTGNYYRERLTPQKSAFRSTPRSRQQSFSAESTFQIQHYTPYDQQQPKAQAQRQVQRQAQQLTQALFSNTYTMSAYPQVPKKIITPPHAMQAPPTTSRQRSTSKRDALPPSSPIPQYSPPSSSPRLPKDVASSPYRMESDPAEVTDANLPFVVPPGPYSSEKPDISYAALIGRAILASPHHKLRLKDIYDYISIVHPFYKREGHSHSQKWMNAIRQNLTNTVQFYKEVHPDGTSKGSLWCVADEDLACFEGGGYNRHARNAVQVPAAVNVPVNVPAPAPAPTSSSNVKKEKRKRKRDDDLQKMEVKKIQLAPPSSAFPNPYHFPYGFSNQQMQYPVGAGPQAPYYYDQSGSVMQNPDLIFPPLPPSHPSAHLINFAQTQPAQEEQDSGVLFPPLPPYSQTRLAREATLREAESSSSSLHDNSSSPTMPPSSSESSFMSVPALTPNNSSSSPACGEDEVLGLTYPDSNHDVIIQDEGSPSEEVLTVQPSDIMAHIDKGKGRAVDAISLLPAMPSTPTRVRKPLKSTRVPAQRLTFNAGALSDDEDDDDEERRGSSSRPSTPPNKNLSVSFNTSLMRTPIAAKTPTRSSVRFKSNVDGTSDSEDKVADDEQKSKPKESDSIFRTPSKNASSIPFGNANTPRGIGIFSPGGWGFSPFRTPSRRLVVDHSDPRLILDEELAALASAAERRGMQDSPGGMFGHAKNLLYESPSLPSPSNHWKPW